MRGGLRQRLDDGVCDVLGQAAQRILVVGAGFAGAVYARELAEAGFHVDVIDRRDHIAGNAYDTVHATGVRYHVYGPHIFHTSIDEVVRWLTRFGHFIPYRHSVTVAMPDGAFAPLPINIETLNLVFGLNLETEADAKRFVDGLAAPDISEHNAAEYLYSKLGRKLTDLFFRPYTKKMWALDLEDMEAAVVKRIPIRFDHNTLYFPDDTFQVMPADGYTALFASIFDHANISVQLATPFEKAMLDEYDYIFNSMPIDEFYDYRFGALPYRSIRFHHQIVDNETDAGPTSVVNFCDDGIHTRRTDWAKFPAHRVTDTGEKLLTLEEPCDYRDNNFERYYPVKSLDGSVAATYAAYKGLADDEPKLTFIGRCGTYRYLDMHQVINQSLQGVRKWTAAAASACERGVAERAE